MNPIVQNLSIDQKLLTADRRIRSNGAKRLMWYLHRNGPSFTGDVASTCAVCNISDAASKANEHLIPLGLKIVAQLPEKLINNRFGDKSMSHEWQITVLR